MKVPAQRSLLVVLLMAASATALSATATFVKRESGKNGQLLYTYKYFCSNGAEGMISVSAADDTTAKKLADVKAKVVCEE